METGQINELYVRTGPRGFPQSGHEAGGTEQQPGAGGGAIIAMDEQFTEALKAFKVSAADDVAVLRRTDREDGLSVPLSRPKTTTSISWLLLAAGSA